MNLSCLRSPPVNLRGVSAALEVTTMSDGSANRAYSLKYGGIEQLVKAAEPTLPGKDKMLCKKIYGTAETLFREAERARLNQNLEDAYIFYYRFAMLAMTLRKSPDYSSVAYPLLDKAAKAISEAEILRRDLEKLYEKKKIEENQSTPQYQEQPQDRYLTATQLYNLLQQTGRCLVIDVRDEESFRESHLLSDYVINLPPKTLKSTMGSTQFNELIKQSQTNLGDFDEIVIMDYDTRNPLQAGIPENHPIKVLSGLVTNCHTKCKKPPSVLSGGFRIWQGSYPGLTVSQSKEVGNVEYPDIGDVAYPTLTENIPMPSAPPIERTRKPLVEPSSTGHRNPLQSLSSLSNSESNLSRPSSAPRIPAKPQAPDPNLKPRDSTLGRKSRDSKRLVNGVEKTVGLKNLGNTCYMNATLQCLAHTKLLVDFFLGGSFEENLNKDSGSGSGGRLPAVVEQLFCDMYSDTRYDGLVKFTALMGKLFSAYSMKQQQDAHEFLLNLLNTLHDDLNSAPQRNSKNSSESPNISEKNVEIALNTFFSQHKDRNSSVVSEVFEGILMSQLECATCKNSSFTFEVFSVLSLPIPELNDQVVQLEDCFREFFKVESLGDRIWDCPHCKAKRNAEKRLRIARLPKTLVIQFVRFKHDGGCFGSEKIAKYVDFGDTINLDNFLDKKTQPKSKSYSLFGLVNHTGNLAAGHYTAYCRSLYNKWHKYDDSIVTAVPFPGESEKKSTYIAFYDSGS